MLLDRDSHTKAMRIAGIRIAGLENKAHAHAIAAFVQRRGAAYSGELLDEFGISHQTLRRRRPQLARLGVRFFPNGRGSVYMAEAVLAYQLPTRTDYERPAAHVPTAFRHPEKGAGAPDDPDTIRTDEKGGDDRGTTEVRPRQMEALAKLGELVRQLEAQLDEFRAVAGASAPAVASFPCPEPGCVFDEGSQDALGRHWLSVHRL